MPGNATNGLPTISAPILNTTTLTAPLGLYTNLTAAALVAVDTETPAGQPPQSVAATVFMIAALAGAFITNTATSTAAAATLNTTSGRVYTEALTTAAGASYVFTLTNSLMTTATAAPQVIVKSGTNSGGSFKVASVVNGSGTCVITITNVGTTAFNGTINIMFHT